MSIRVRYASASDGTRIAYAISGDGVPVVYLPPMPLRHLEREWQLPEDKRWLERLGRGRQLVGYDPRGLGLSERNIADLSLEAFVADLAAVVDAVGVERQARAENHRAARTENDRNVRAESDRAARAANDRAPRVENDGDPAVGNRVALFAAMNSAPTAIAYAVRHPERVSHLLLWCAVARAADAFSPRVGMLLDLADKDWHLFTEAAAHQMVGWDAGAAANRYAEYLRACLAPEVARPLLTAIAAHDATDLLPALRVPTLVLHRRSIESLPVAHATTIASRIPDARLVLLDGEVIRPGVGDMESAARVVDEFLGDVAELPGDVVAPSLGAASTPTVGAASMLTVGAAAIPMVGFASTPAATDPTAAAAIVGSVFRREGDFWTIAFDGRVARVRDVKGLHHLARLLREPGRGLAPSELLADLDPPPGDTADVAGLQAAALGDAGAVLDAEAKAAYRRRLADLRSALDEAERDHDRGRAEAARSEIELLSHELAAAVGLGGRDRKAASGAERARLTVTKRIHDALARLETHHPVLARHLAATIKTGRLCAYEPDPSRPIVWSF